MSTTRRVIISVSVRVSLRVGVDVRGWLWGLGSGECSVNENMDERKGEGASVGVCVTEALSCISGKIVSGSDGEL